MDDLGFFFCNSPTNIFCRTAVLRLILNKSRFAAFRIHLLNGAKFFIQAQSVGNCYQNQDCFNTHTVTYRHGKRVSPDAEDILISYKHIISSSIEILCIPRILEGHFLNFSLVRKNLGVNKIYGN